MKYIIGLFASLFVSAMSFGADVAVSALPAASAIGGTEAFACVQTTTKKCTANQLLTFINANGTPNIASATGTLPSTSFPVLTGDVTNTALATTVGKINGVALSGLSTGILKNTTTTGVPSIAIAADFPTLNQATTGNAATATALASAPTQCSGGQAATGVAASGNANCAATFSGVTSLNGTSIPSAATLLTNGGAAGTPSSITLTNATGLPCGALPALTGDATSSGCASTLATVNGNVGSFTYGSFTVNGKGLITAASNGSAPAAAANPTGTTGLAAVNGVATTFLRSDGSPALSQSITPTWTGLHTYTNSDIALLGSSTGKTTFTSANAGASNFTATIPANTGTIAELNLAQSFTATQTFAGVTLGGITGSTQCLQVDTSGVVSGTTSACGGSGSTGANPTATAGLTAVNGVATTFLRSDGSPAVSQSIVPTWTGIHTFSATPVLNAGLTLSNAANTYTQTSTGLSLTSGATGFGRNIVGTVNDATAVDGVIDFANILCTLCTATTNLIDYQVGSVSKYKVDTTGAGTFAGALNVTGQSNLANIVANNTSTVSWSGRGTLSSPAAGGVQLGSTNSATPTNQTLSTQGSRGGTDSNVAGANLAIQSGLGTGNAAGSTLSLQTPHAGTTGTTAETATTQILLGDNTVGLPGIASGVGTGSICYGASNTLTTSTAICGINVTLAGTAATTMTFPATTGTVDVLNNAQTFTAVKTFTNSDLALLGSSTGATTFTSDNAGASNFTLHVPAANDTIATLAAAQALTNKTYNGNTFTAGTGVLTLGAGKTLGVTNTLSFAGTDSTTFTFPAINGTVDVLNNAATYTAVKTFTNSDLAILGSSTGATTVTSDNAGASNFTMHLPAANDTLATIAGTQTLTNKSIDAAQLTGSIVAARMPALTGDATTTAGAVAVTVGKINGTALSGLATGILKNTTTTGVPSIATSADVLATFSGTCNSTTFTRGDGACATPAGSGTVTTTGSPATGNLAKFSGTTSIVNGDLSGDVTTSGTLAATVVKVNGAVVPTSAAVLASNGSNQLTALTLGGNLSVVSGALVSSQTLNAQTGTTYAILGTDAGKLITASNAASQAYSIAQAGTTGFTSGYSFDIQNKGAGTVTITPTTSTINGASTLAIATNLGCTVSSDGTNYQVSACTAVAPAGGVAAPTQNAQAGSYTFVLGDANSVQVYHTSGTAHTWTIPANSSVAYPVGTILTGINETGGGVLTIAITTDTLIWGGLGTTGSRSVAAAGMFQAVKVTSTSWIITGAGVS